jgi:hypothetical protein
LIGFGYSTNIEVLNRILELCQLDLISVLGDIGSLGPVKSDKIITDSTDDDLMNLSKSEDMVDIQIKEFDVPTY